MEISSSLGLKNTLKLALGFSSRGLLFGGFFNPWDEEIFIPETRPIRESYIFTVVKFARIKKNCKIAAVLTFCPCDFRMTPHEEIILH